MDNKAGACASMLANIVVEWCLTEVYDLRDNFEFVGLLEPTLPIRQRLTVTLSYSFKLAKVRLE